MFLLSKDSKKITVLISNILLTIFVFSVFALFYKSHLELMVLILFSSLGLLFIALRLYGRHFKLLIKNYPKRSSSQLMVYIWSLGGEYGEKAKNALMASATNGFVSTILFEKEICYELYHEDKTHSLIILFFQIKKKIRLSLDQRIDFLKVCLHVQEPWFRRNSKVEKLLKLHNCLFDVIAPHERLCEFEEIFAKYLLVFNLPKLIEHIFKYNCEEDIELLYNHTRQLSTNYSVFKKFRKQFAEALKRKANKSTAA